MRNPDFGTATSEEISAGFSVAMHIAEEIFDIKNPAVQNMVKDLVALIHVAEVGGKG